MTRYILRRLLWAVVLLVLVSALTFVVFDVMPAADPAVLRAGRNATPETIAAIRHDLGLDQPITVQFWQYLKGVFLHFDFGYSYTSNTSVREQILSHLPATLSLTAGAACVWLLFGLPIGIVSALRPGSLRDRVLMGGALVLMSAPPYFLALAALYLVSDDLGKVPLLPGADSYTGLTASPGQWFASLVLPWLVLGAGFVAIYARLLRGSLRETMATDYVRTARAKGLSERRVLVRHGLRSAITPLVTMLGLDIGVLLGGAVLVERVFDIPGIGRLGYEAITHGDYPTIQGTVLFAAMFVIVANAIVDIAYALLDPRVVYE
jgi:peptide/nickel transport system permease protein